ncbi:hypothetical protein A8B82_06955 [Sulfitobacter sp. EhC04]|nr:hypothetical protein A8B82_06955 [Sulfitobacter sp. EhC04]
MVASDQPIALVSEQGEEVISGVRSCTLGDLEGNFDAIIFMVKHYDLLDAAQKTASFLRPSGCAIGLQNGVSSWDTLNSVFEADRLCVGSVYLAATKEDDFRVSFAGKKNHIVLGSYANGVHPVADALADTWREAGVSVTTYADVRIELWMKFLGFATNAALTCLARLPAGTIYHEANRLSLAERSIDEIISVANAEGLTLPDDAKARTVSLLQSFPPEMVASMRKDLDAGRRLELDVVSGRIVGLAKKHDLQVPLHEIAFACLEPFAAGRKPH